MTSLPRSPHAGRAPLRERTLGRAAPVRVDVGRPARVLEDVALSLSRRRGGIILCFHEIDVVRFTRWVEILLPHLRLVGLDELVDRHHRGESLSRLLAVTFDDGWARTCEPVAEVCERRRWPVTIYAISSIVTGGGTLWFAELPALLRDAAGRRVKLDGRVLDLTSRRAAAATYRSIVHWLRAMPRGEAMAAIDAFRAALGRPAVQRDSDVFIGERFVRQHANSAWIAFGSHSVDHQCLAAQDEAAQRRQLAESKAVLEEITGRPVAHFCYPYGDATAVGTAAPRVARTLYRSATTLVRGVCGEHSGAWYLPRIPLYDTDGDTRMVAKVALAGIV